MSYTATMARRQGSPRTGRRAYRAGDFIFDWNELNRKGGSCRSTFTLVDETLRDGLQNPSVEDPPSTTSSRILHLMDDLEIEHADVGLPGSGKRAFDDVLRLCKEVVDCKMNIQVGCAGRTVVGDITPMIEISQRTGLPIESTPSSARARSASSSSSGTWR